MPAGRKPDAVADYLHGSILPSVGILLYDAEAARGNAIERARLAVVGRSIPFADGLVAAVAVRFDLTLVTHNGQDFS
jgi:tRNA(fMet)-specific endonuclease VapC